MINRNERIKKIIRYSYITLSILVAFCSAILLWYFNISDEWSTGYNGNTTLFMIGVLFSFTYWIFAKLYAAHKIGLYRFTELLYSQALAFAISDAIIFVESVFWFHGFEKLNILYYVIAYIGQLFVISIFVFVFNRLFAKVDEPRKTLIIYGNEDYIDLYKELLKKNLRYNVIGCYHESVHFDEIKDLVDQSLNIYLYEVTSNLKNELILYCNSKDKTLYITQDIQDLLMRNYDVSHSFDIPLIRTKKEQVKWYYPIFKRSFDILASSCALLILSPILIIVAILIKLQDGGPIFYKQIRLTKDHKEFEIYKFRSMVVNAEQEGAQLATQNDSRITKLGHFIRMTRIDELPQLLNILKGDMSVIGPRPERPEIEEEYLKELPEFGLRLQVKAGLSGYAQVFGKYNTTPKNKLKLDLLYINQRSVLLDLKIILYTIKIIFVPESTEGFEETKVFNEKEELCH